MKTAILLLERCERVRGGVLILGIKEDVRSTVDGRDAVMLTDGQSDDARAALMSANPS